MISRLLLIGTLLIATLTAFAQASFSVKYEYAPITFPGARITTVNGINNSNVIVGYYFDSQDNVHGFMYNAGKYTAINYPKATLTQVLGINDNGDIVGVYQLSGALNFHGFLRHNGSFTSIDDPAAKIGTTAFGINNAGTIVGSYDNAQGFVYDKGAYRTLNAPQMAGEPHQTQLNGINKLGWIVGQVFTRGIWRGFWVENGQFHFIEPAGSRDSQAMGINGHNDVAGCHDAEKGFVSFAVGNFGGPGDALKFPPEEPVASCISSINFARAIVGNFFTVKNSGAFLGVPAITLKVSSPSNETTVSNPVHVVSTATGLKPISRIEIWVNFKKVFQVKSGTLDAHLKIPTGSEERFAVKAIDAKGRTTKVVDAITVH